jgi:hypothetical protein
MALHFFTIPALTPQTAQDEFNRFCLTHRVLRWINTARANAAVREQQAQRAYDNLLATLIGTQSLMFRQRLLSNGDTEMDLYTIDSGCRP